MSVFNRTGRFVTQDVMTDLGPGAHPRISIKGSHFSLIDGGGIKYPWPALVLPIVIIGANPKRSKVYYADKFDPDNPTPPTCYSDNGLAPSVNAGEPQARTCVECPHYGWGSATSALTGKKTKACDDKKKLAVVVPGDTAMLAYELQVPPTGLKNLNTYAAMITSMTIPDGSRRADLSDVVTLVSFNPDQVGLLEFQQWGWIDSVGPDHRLHYNPQGQPIEAPDGGETFGTFIDDLWDLKVDELLVNFNDQPHAAAAAGLGAAPQPAQVAPPRTMQSVQDKTGQGRPPVATGPAGYQPAPRPVAPPFAPPAGAQPQQPAQVPAAAPRGRGGARTGAGRPAMAKPASTSAPPFIPSAAAPPGSVAPPPERVDDGLAVPAFLQRSATPPASGASARNGTAPLQDAEKPPVDIQSAINTAFGLPT